MPPRPQKQCKRPGCFYLTQDASDYCPACRHLAKKNWSVNKDYNRKSSSKRGYNSRWRKARASFLASHPLCVECKKKGRITEATVVDHIIPHRGDSNIFWDSSNWQPLCSSCHSRKTAKGE